MILNDRVRDIGIEVDTVDVGPSRLEEAVGVNEYRVSESAKDLLRVFGGVIVRGAERDRLLPESDWLRLVLLTVLVLDSEGSADRDVT